MIYDQLQIDVSNAMKKFWASHDTRKNQKSDYAKKSTTKVRRKVNDYVQVKKEIEKAKSEIEDGIAYGKDNIADLGGNMVSTCACAGCPGKSKHKTAASKTCAWHKKLIGVKAAAVPKTLAKFAATYSHDVRMDVAEVLLKNLDARGGEPLSLLDASAILEVERNKLLRDGTRNAKNEATDTNAKNLEGSHMEERASGKQLICLPCSNIPTSTNIVTSSNGAYVHETSAGVLNVNPDKVSNVRTEVEQKIQPEFTVDRNFQPDTSIDSDENSLSQAVDCVEFLDTIALNHDPNDEKGSVEIDLDAVEEYIKRLHNLHT